jgi:hypothetical protein
MNREKDRFGNSGSLYLPSSFVWTKKEKSKIRQTKVKTQPYKPY